MEINTLPKSQMHEPKGAVAVPALANGTNGGPPKGAGAPKPAIKAVEAKKEPNGSTAAVKAAETATAGTKTEITDVKPTGEANAEGDPTFTLKVNGKEYKATQSEIIALAQKAQGAEAAMKKAAEIEKLASNFIENFDSDVYGMMVKRHGKEKADQMVIAMTKKLIAEEEKDPKEREIERLKAENETHKQAEERVKKEAEEAAKRVKQQAIYKQMLTDIDAALNETHLPKDKLTLTRVLNYLAAGKKANGTVWTVKDAVAAVETEDMGHISYYAKRFVDGKLPSDKFRELFGDDALKKLNKEQINLLKNADKIAKNETVKVEAAHEEPVERRPRTLSKTKGAEGMSEREYRRKFGSFGGI